MFNLNPFHLEDASLLHFLMVQGTALLAYFIFRERYKRQLARLADAQQTLQNAYDTQQIVEPEVEEVFHNVPGRDNLSEISGINTKAEAILNGVGIYTFTQLANTPVSTVRRVLAEHGPLIFTDDPVTWPKQAWLAAEGRWDELRLWQDQMSRGIYSDFHHKLLL